MTPHHITARQSVAECQDVLFANGNEEAIRFTHVVLDLPDSAEIISVLEHMFATPALSKTCAVIVADVKQRREITTAAPQMDFKKLAATARALPLQAIKTLETRGSFRPAEHLRDCQ